MSLVLDILEDSLVEQDVELIASYNEKYPPNEDKVGPWINCVSQNLI
jgi:hypothetical protein